MRFSRRRPVRRGRSSFRGASRGRRSFGRRRGSPVRRIGYRM